MRIIEKDWKWKGKTTKRDRTDTIILHHAKALKCTAEDVDSWHKENGWLGIGYHFFIGKDGTVTRGRPELSIGAHAVGHNHNSISICLEGNFEVENAKFTQVSALIELLKYLKLTYDVEIIGHNNVNKTKCPAGLNVKAIVDAVDEPKQEHWAEKHYENLKRKGVTIHERRFDDKITRGEVFAILDRLTDKMI